MSTAANFRNVKMSACDRISDLPSSIIESILMWLPTRGAARTSILSRKWRYNWSRIPQLVLDDKIFNKILTNHALPGQKFAEILFQILSLHQGPISKFRCSLTGLKDCRDIDSLIVLLSRSGVQEFTLNLWLNEYHRMPLAFFSCLELRHLNLRGCLIKPPTNFQDFGHLISLKLCQVNIAEDVLGSLMSSSLLLEQLTVVEIPAILNSLELIAPKLKSVFFKSSVKSILFKNTPVLARVSLVPRNQDMDGKFHVGGTSIIEQLHDLLSLENLHLHYAYFKSLDAGGIPAKITTTLIHLKVVKLEYLCFEEVNEIAVLLCLLRSSPNLHELEILVYKVDEYAEGQVSNFLDVQEYSQLTLNQLRQVKLQNISGTRSEMEIIKLLLKKSSILEKMLIKQAPMKENIKNKVTEIGILKQVTRFHRSSPRAAVIYEDPIIS